MAKIKLNGDTSGYIEISAPAVSGNNTLELGPGTRILTNYNTFTGVSTFTSNLHVTGGGFTLNQQRSDTHASLIIDKPDAGTGTLKFFNNGSASAYIQHTGAEHLHYYLPSGSGYHAFYTNGSNERLRIASDGIATFNAENININRNAGDPFIALQTSGTSNAALYGGASTGFRVFTKPSGGSLTERLRVTNDGNVLLGNNTSDSTASPVNLDLGGTYSNSGGNNPKFNVWKDSAGEYMSLGVSSNQMDFMMSMDDFDFVWYGQNDSNNGPEERMRLDNGEKLLDFASTSKIRLKGASAAGTTHAHINIGTDGAGSSDTRAIDIWGNWSNQESKTITWNHGTGTSDMVCQQRVRYNTGPSSTVYEIGRFYNGQNTTAYPFQLQSTSTTTADLTVEGNVLHKTAAFVARSTVSNNITSTTRQKIDYTVDYSYQSVFDNTNDRFTCQKAGLYFFYARHWFGSNSSGTIYLDFLKNGSLIKEFRVTHPSSSGEYESIQGSGMIYMAVNDYLEVYGRSDGSGIFHESNGAAYSEFSGFYVSGG